MATTVTTGLVNKIAITGCKIERVKIVTPIPFIQFGTIERRMLNFNDYSDKIIEEYEQTMSAFDEQCYDIVRKAHMRVTGTRMKANGTLIYKKMGVMKAEKLERRQQRRLDAEKAFQSGDPYIITEINNAWHCNIKACEPEKRGLIFCTRSQKVRKNYKNVVHLRHTTTLDLAMNICSSFVKEGKPIEIIGKGKRRAIKCRSIHADNRRVLKVNTAHERRVKRSIDFKMDPSVSLVLEFLAIHTWKGRIISDQQVKKGMSGFVIPLASFTADIPEASNSVFIVRGRDGDDLVDAREIVPRHEIDSIEHY
nr:P1 [Tobacco vein banding mosaic virus]